MTEQKYPKTVEQFAKNVALLMIDIFKNNSNKIILLSLMLWDKKDGVIIPSYTENSETNSDDTIVQKKIDNNKWQVYFCSEQKVMDMADDLMNNLKNENKPFFNSVLFDNEKKKKGYLVDKKLINGFDVDVDYDKNNYNIKNREKLDPCKKFSTEFQGTIKLHQDALNEKQSWIFFPITFQTIGNSALFYITSVVESIENNNSAKDTNPSNFNSVDIPDELTKLAYDVRKESIGLLEIRILELQESLRKSQIKSAVAAIMSRNMSHNLGSHVLSNLKSYLDKVSLAIKGNKDGGDFSFEFDIDGKTKLEQKDLFGLKWFINYLQERQDFIATIGGFDNQTFMPVNFKTFVFDGFLPDDQFERHRHDSESIKDSSNILLNYIAKSENIERENIIIKFGEFDSKDELKKDQVEIDFEKLVKLNVSLPGGIVGRQAIFSILENIIRNAAKHGNVAECLDLTIQAVTDEDKNKRAGVNFNNFIEITIHDNLGNFDTAKGKLNAINEGGIKILSDDSDKHNNKGIKEMLISAAWLRGIPVEGIDDFKQNTDEGIPPILTFESYEEKEEEKEKKHVQYRFYLLKPKEVCIVLKDDKFKKEEGKETNVPKDIDKEIVGRLKQNGIDFIPYSQVKTEKNLRHSLFVVEDEKLECNNICDYFNRRVHFLEYKKIKQILTESVSDVNNIEYAEKVATGLWKSYLSIADDNSFPKIYISPKVKDAVAKNNFYPDSFVIGDLPADQEKNKNASTNGVTIYFNDHNDTEIKFQQFRGLLNDKGEMLAKPDKNKQERFNNLVFLEGISGGNSTELLTSKTKLTELYYYKLLQSCLTQVLIIDERLWNNNSDINISDIERPKLDEKSYKKIISQSIENNKIAEFDKYIRMPEGSNFTSTKKSLVKIENFDNFKQKLAEKKAFYRESEKPKNDFKYQLYKKKGVEVANIVLDNDSVKLYNLNYENIVAFSNNETAKTDLTIFKERNKQKIVSIHQGIIDKMKKIFDSEEKVIKAINSIFDDKSYIKIIHSGRGKPSDEISKGFYFIPYASLENAFYDCKFSLTELLYNAKKELT